MGSPASEMVEEAEVVEQTQRRPLQLFVRSHTSNASRKSTFADHRYWKGSSR